VPTGRQLSSAIGGATDLPANPGAASAPLTPAPLTVAAPLPTVQVGPIIAQAPDAWSSGGPSDPRVLPASLPEPGGLALFAVILLGSALKIAVRRLRLRGTIAPWAS
ncbi:MAG TPA: hypothetical protein VKW77_00440, partial [Acidimicrobiales bacterium]|nr:hypothetical protein [Acidimicrobiales bacterium]